MHLLLFFTRNVSLSAWDNAGILEREVALYRGLQAAGIRVSFVSYGDSSEMRFADRLGGLEILCNRWGLPLDAYARFIPILHWRHLRRAAIYKTNQIEGSRLAIFCRRLFQKKLIVRGGFLWSRFARAKHGRASAQAELAREREASVFESADAIVLTTETMKEEVVERYRVSPDKIAVIPNYVNTGLFQPPHNGRSPGRRIVCVGRLDEQKNLQALIEAAAGIDVEVVLIGDGPQRKSLGVQAYVRQVPVYFAGRIPNTELPEHLGKCSVYVQPSFYEGHPKALLEAMACGLPVIGADVTGIREVLTHRENGYLCGTSPGELRAAVEVVLADGTLRERMARQAREFVSANFSLDRVLELELDLINRVA